MAQSYRYFTEDQHELLLGCILGDGSLRWGTDTAAITLGHGEEQDEYCRWKAATFDCRPYVDKNRHTFAHTVRSSEFERYRGIEKHKALLHLPDEIIDALTIKAIAIWYMDDGTFSGSYEKWGQGKVELAAAKLPKTELEKIAMKISSLGLGYPTPRPGRGLMWSGEQSRQFQEKIVRYIHPSMRYKIKPGRTAFEWNVNKMNSQLDIVQARVAKKEWRQAPKGPGKSGIRFNLKVDGGAALLVDGVVVSKVQNF